EQTFSVTAGNVLVIPSPPAQIDLTGYNVYISTTSGAETRQNPVPIPIGTSFTLPTSGLITGAAPPTGNFACGADHQDSNRYFEADLPEMSHLFVRGYLYIKSSEPGTPAIHTQAIQRKLMYLKSPAG